MASGFQPPATFAPSYPVALRNPSAYSPVKTRTCADRCVIVATLGLWLRHDYAYVPLSFKAVR